MRALSLTLLLMLGYLHGDPTRPVLAAVPATGPAGKVSAAPSPSATQSRRDGDDSERTVWRVTLPTDAEVDVLLRRAREHVAAQRYAEAVAALQSALDRPGGTLTTIDGRTYRPSEVVLNEVIAALPAEAVKTYRLVADPTAHALVGDPRTTVDREGLQTVVRRLFLSSAGDVAAYRLACLDMDRGDFAQARRLLSRILRDYPDPNTDRGELLVRLAYACARAGDAAGAKAAWQQLLAAGKRPAKEALEAIEREVALLPSTQPQALDGWRMAFGSTARTGQSPDLPAPLATPSRSAWCKDWDLAVPTPVGGIDPKTGRWVVALEELKGAARHSALGWQEQNRALPACQLILVGERVFYKTGGALVCCDARTGRRLWETAEHESPDPAPPRERVNVGRSGHAGEEVHGLFLDHLARAISVVGERIYHIEENSKAVGTTARARALQAGRPVEGLVALEGNALAAHDAATGRRLWRLGRESEAGRPLSSVRFLSPPADCLGKLLVCAEVDSALVLLALEPADGSILWKAPLCPVGTAPYVITRPVSLCAVGTDIYLAPGRGVLFRLDAADGALQWASCYDSPPRAGRVAMSGWQDDYVTVAGNLVIVVPSDSNSVMAFERDSGRLVFAKEVEDPRYCLGVHDGGIFTVSARGLSRLDIAKADWSWHTPVAGSAGRGVLAGGVVYLPRGNSIVRIDIATGRCVGELALLQESDEPVGNLRIASDRLLLAGMDRISAWVSARKLETDLDRRLTEQRDPALLIERGRLRIASAQMRTGLADLLAALQLLPPTDPRAADLRMEIIRATLGLARQADAPVDEELATAARIASTPGERALAAVARAQSMAHQGKWNESAAAWMEAMNSTGDALLDDAEARGLHVAPWAVATAAVGKLLNTAPEEVQTKLLAAVREQVGRLDGSPQLLGPLACMGEPRLAGLVRQVAARLSASGRAEVAEVVLGQFAEAREPAAAAAGLAALAEVRQSLGWRGQARRDWQRLAADHATVALAGFENSPKAGELAQKRLAELAEAGGAMPTARMPPPPWKTAWALAAEELALLQPRAAAASEALADSVLLLDTHDNSIRCHRLSDGQRRWRLELPRPEQGAVTAPAVAHRRAAPGASVAPLVHTAHVGFVRVGRCLLAYSLLTGQEIWRLPGAWEPGAHLSSDGVTPTTAGISAGYGLVVVRSSPGQVRVFDACTGRLRWQRQFIRATVGNVDVQNGYVLIALSRARHAMGFGTPTAGTLVCDRLTGQLLGEASANFVKGDGAVVWTPWGCVANGTDATMGTCIDAWDLPAGRKCWSAPGPDATLARLLTAQDAAGKPVLLASGSKSLIALDPAAGTRLWLANTPAGAAQMQQMGVTPEGQILAIFPQLRDPNRPRGGMTAAFYGLRDGNLTREVVLGGHAGGLVILPLDLSGCAHWLPVARMDTPPAPRLGRPATFKHRISAYALDAGGEARPQDVPIPGGNNGIEQLRAMVVVNDHLLLLGEKGITAIASEPRRPSP